MSKSKSTEIHFVHPDNSQEYFVREHYYLLDRNKLDTDVRHLCRENIDGIYMTYGQMKVIYNALLKDIEELNQKHLKVKNKINPGGFTYMNHDGSIFLNFHEGLKYVAYKTRKNLTRNG